ncbi:YagK/YfjJ domain-containing protein [Acinetobacter baumannii]|uniref:YagK/YfjJ domain-containing protein n=1 Tax=Acinetobacter baumannii TaxID=470 RepID=UPI001360528E|nr:inovirus-type Gp2 protein [Acinetobacter baumannii]MDV4326281.1 inovirus Gp2 family protein [Acinetobacter baumannii]CAA0202608.1 Protein of unknown function (DUF3296) [Acinetobacter baumannii]
MNKSQLLHNAGTFTLEEQLALLRSDLGSTDITAPDGSSRKFLHAIDPEAEICVNIVSAIDKCKKTNLPIAKLKQEKTLSSINRYWVHFPPTWKLLEEKLRSAFHHEFSKNYFYSEEVKAWMHIQSQFTSEELAILARLLPVNNRSEVSIQTYVELFNHFTEQLKEYVLSAEYKKKIRDRDATKNANKNACIELFNHLIAKFARVLVVRVDFSLKRDMETILKHASTMEFPYSRNDLVYIKKCMRKFKNNWRSNKLLNDIQGYIFQYEYSHATGFHIHAYFFFDGNKHREDITIAKYISDYWKNITKNQGSTYICNLDKENYKYCAIGMIHYANKEKQAFLFQTFEYICKADQFFIFSELKNSKRFQRSELPEPKASSGRSRQDPPTESN